VNLLQRICNKQMTPVISAALRFACAMEDEADQGIEPSGIQ